MRHAGRLVDVVVSSEAIVACGPGAAAAFAVPDADCVDLGGWCALPAACEPHAHLDKAFLVERTGPVHGDVRQAVQAVAAYYASASDDDLADRARRAASLALRHGVTALRSHVDVGGAIGFRALLALAALRAELAPVMDVQLVALPIQPVSGPDGQLGRRVVEEAIALGADVVGGGPWLDVAPLQAVDELTAIAHANGRPLDLHVDETTDASVLTLERLVHRVAQLGLEGRVTASHCVSLGELEPGVADRLARAVAEAGIAVVTLPQTNLYLQARTAASARLRGIPPLGLLEAAGVSVAAGGDNWRDPFNPVGRVDPLETASLLVSAGHVAPALAYAMVSERARALLHLPAASLRPGDAADLLCVKASGVGEAVASGTEERIVVRRGRVVARSELSISGALWPEAGRGSAPPGGRGQLPPARRDAT
jgi:cytosine deaminase